MRERKSNSRTARRAAAEGGALSRILDFDFLSRFAPPSKQWRNPLLSYWLIAREPGGDDGCGAPSQKVTHEIGDCRCNSAYRFPGLGEQFWRS
jgi:hypothetical protein